MIQLSKKEWLIVGAIAATLAAGYSQKDVIKSMTITDKEALSNRNVQAFLRAIRAGESSQGPEAYNMLVFGGTFSDMSTHPNIRKPLPNNPNNWTTAAGAYQITYTTWKWLSILAGVKDFTPASQDKMAIAYLRKLGALDAIIKGDYKTAAEKSKNTWEAFTVPKLKQRIDVAYINYGGSMTAGVS